MDPSGRVCLVTGAAGGLGRAFCRALLAAGAKVVASDIDDKNGEKFAAELSKEFGDGNVIFVKADVTISDSLEEAFKAAKSTFSRLDILVNNAGILREDLWQKEVDVNVKGTVHGLLLSQRHMGKAGGAAGGLVVNVSSSIAGVRATPHVPIYSATKHAVAALSRNYGAPVHAQSSGVSVVALCPGAADTPLLHNMALTYLHPYLKPEIDHVLHSPYSTPEFIAEGLMRVIREAKSGSVWLAEEGKIEEVVYPANLQ